MQFLRRDKRNKMDIRSMYLTELEEWLKEKGYPAFRAKQLYQWLHEKHVATLEEMTNIPKNIKEDIDSIGLVTIEEELRQESAKDGTIKFLYRMQDGQMIETVFMKYSYGNSICISSQAGCRMGCKFCASTIGGLIRNLTASEMLEQVYMTMRLTGERISNIVVMGTGEPLDNYDNLIRFIRIISDEKGYNISQRNITVSSCGIVPNIRRLADEDLTITFALSLHGTTDEERKELMPIAHQYSLKETIDCCKEYFDKTGRRLTFEYSLVKGQNDTADHALRLAKLLKGINCHVNLIPVNPISERDFRPGDRESIEKFKLILEKNSINGTIRKSVGSDIDAACGQLRRKHRINSQEEADAVERNN
ncbi:MAG: 23S rRNA (adenine(2503)-C(2))-methyltransferase RlmN [Lachnospiraceae bacterium]|nr:23S rRNA (adenine(2503)-C(2))-methyltransferase RlmN [Lachnospiraceae bacterium]